MGAGTAAGVDQPGGAQAGAGLRRCSGRGRGQHAESSSSPVASAVPSSPKSVLKRPVSTEELQGPGARFVRKSFTVVGDAVGWGFVVRGDGPCHIQAVEPSGPTAAAGLKVRHFLVSVNRLSVLSLDYRSLSHLILTRPRTVVMEVMEETQH